MKTSNFARAGKNPNAVAISRGIPKGFSGRTYQKLGPAWAMIKLPEDEYIRQYNAILAKLDPKKVYEELGENAILLCYEKPGDFCHRRIVAEWLKKSLGIVVPELGFESEGLF